MGTEGVIKVNSSRRPTTASEAETWTQQTLRMMMIR